MLAGDPPVKAIDTEGQQDVTALLGRVCQGDAAAWQAFWTWLDPRLEALLRRPRFLPRLAQRDDDRRAVVLAVMAKLQAEGFRRLKLFVATPHPAGEGALMAWLAVVAKRVGIDHLRALPDYLDQRGAPSGPAGAWVEAGPLPSDSRMPGARPPFTAQGTAAQMLAFAQRELPPLQGRALELWIQGQSPSEIAAALGISNPGEAEQVLRAAVMRLRRRFRSSGQGHAP
jgi:DNA-directed RNA polymerase specialized sigma24 family protein